MKPFEAPQREEEGQPDERADRQHPHNRSQAEDFQWAMVSLLARGGCLTVFAGSGILGLHIETTD
jgi:hypothetical protein